MRIWVTESAPHTCKRFICTCQRLGKKFVFVFVHVHAHTASARFAATTVAIARAQHIQGQHTPIFYIQYSVQTSSCNLAGYSVCFGSAGPHSCRPANASTRSSYFRITRGSLYIITFNFKQTCRLFSLYIRFCSTGIAVLLREDFKFMILCTFILSHNR